MVVLIPSCASSSPTFLIMYSAYKLNTTVIQIYAPTSNSEETEVERLYEYLQDLLELIPKRDVLFIIGDWNAQAGSQEIPWITGKFRQTQWHPTPVVLPWKIPWTEEPGGLESMGSLRFRHDSATSLSLFIVMHWRRKWQPTPVFLPGESQGLGAW